jgi:hypothetical protein
MRSLATDPFFIALMTGGNAQIISQPPRPVPPPTETPRKADSFPIDADYQISYDRGDD